MNSVTQDEIRRQYRVLQQTLGIHSILRDEYAWWEKAFQIIILLCSVIFSATTFASDQLYKTLNLPPELSSIILDLAALLAFGLSLVLLVVDWRTRSIEHRDAVNNWFVVLRKFRESKIGSNIWPDDILQELSNSYWEADKNSVEIPDKRFNGLKAKYLKKVAVSELKSSYPGCPLFILSILLFVKDSFKATKHIIGKNDE